MFCQGRRDAADWQMLATLAACMVTIASLFESSAWAQDSVGVPNGTVTGTQLQTPAEVDPETQTDSGRDILDLELDELTSLDLRVPVPPAFDVEIFTAARQPTKVGHSAAAVYVITQEDLRRSGVKTIPDALRMVPGLNVARLDKNKWAISSRGFNGRFANKLEVLMDGRSLYTPLFAGVYWEIQDTVLEDIDRIEVIRGPGAALWGANAVNGVINIITKKASDTQGTLITGGSGTDQTGLASFRQGGKIRDNMHYRVFGKYSTWDNGVDAVGNEAHDGFNAIRGGMRIDWDASDQDAVTLQGDLYDGLSGQTVTLPSLAPPFADVLDRRITMAGGNVLARWAHKTSDDADFSVVAYYDHTERRSLLEEFRDTVEIDFQHRFPIARRHDFLWGTSYRYSVDDIASAPSLVVTPASRGLHLFGYFLQDDMTIVEDRLHLIVGSKFQHNDFTGFVVQPNARVLWMPNERHAAWAAVSCAVRTPSRVEDDARVDLTTVPPGGLFPGSPPALSQTAGDRGFRAEQLLALELGYRVSPVDEMSVDIAAFYNTYDDLRTLEPSAPIFAPSRLLIPLNLSNRMYGETYGVEVASTLAVSDRWNLGAGYTFLDMQLHRYSTSSDPISESAEGNSPHHQFNIRSYVSLPGNLEFDTMLYYVDALPNFGVPSYLRLDARVGWRPRDNVELVLGFQNLLDPGHPEFASTFIDITPTEVERTVYGMVRWRF